VISSSFRRTRPESGRARPTRYKTLSSCPAPLGPSNRRLHLVQSSSLNVRQRPCDHGKTCLNRRLELQHTSSRAGRHSRLFSTRSCHIRPNLISSRPMIVSSAKKKSIDWPTVSLPVASKILGVPPAHHQFSHPPRSILRDRRSFSVSCSDDHTALPTALLIYCSARPP